MIQPRLCNNCRHFRNDVTNFKKCALRTTRTTHVSQKIDLVDGKPIVPKLEYASVVRLPSGDCGEDGKLYEFNTDTMKRTLNTRIDEVFFAVVLGNVFAIIILVKNIVHV